MIEDCGTKDEMLPNKLTLIKDTGWDSMTLQIHKLDVVVAVAVVVEITSTPHPANWLPG